jgi:hypothetical protein
VLRVEVASNFVERSVGVESVTRFATHGGVMLLLVGQHFSLSPVHDDDPLPRRLSSAARVAVAIVAVAIVGAVVVLAVGLTELRTFFERRHVTGSAPGWERFQEFDVSPNGRSGPVRTVANEATAVYPSSRYVDVDDADFGIAAGSASVGPAGFVLEHNWRQPAEGA